MVNENPSNIKLLGERIEELRKWRGLSMRDFAKICGISKTQVNELTNDGVDFRYSTLVKIANGLEMTVSELTNF
jgi:transcriptional regulator with XRE-family HTH domain